MLDTPQKRLEHYIKTQYGTKVAFAKAIGILPTSVTKYAGTKAKSIFGHEYQVKLNSLGLNIAWYLTGQGEMLESEKESEVVKLTRLDEMTISQMRSVLNWIDANYETMKSIVSSLDDK
ncbi:MAG: hypothetical protein M9949_06085 [Candidatus Kapabacteria bacterium]|nr:hypothetical protein [Candidatus Kapabacteria bacterium]